MMASYIATHSFIEFKKKKNRVEKPQVTLKKVCTVKFYTNNLYLN